MDCQEVKAKRPVGRPRKQQVELPPTPKRVPFSKMDPESEEYKEHRRLVLERRRKYYMDNYAELVKKEIQRQTKKKELEGYVRKPLGRPRTII